MGTVYFCIVHLNRIIRLLEMYVNKSTTMSTTLMCLYVKVTLQINLIRKYHLNFLLPINSVKGKFDFKKLLRFAGLVVLKNFQQKLWERWLWWYVFEDFRYYYFIIH
jgi:hypothetical protein